MSIILPSGPSTFDPGSSLTLLQIVQQFCRRQGLSMPNIAATSTDEGVLQMVGMLNELVEELMELESWPETQVMTTFNSTGTDDQGALNTLFPGYTQIIWETAWDRTLRRQLFGPKSAQMWQEALAIPFTGPFYAYRVLNGHLYIQPDLAAGHTIGIEYQCKYGVVSNASTFKRYFDADTDYFRLDEAILLRGLKYKWRKEKGLPWAQDKSDYDGFVAQKIAHDDTHPKLSMDGSPTQPEIKPGIFVPAGNWNV